MNKQAMGDLVTSAKPGGLVTRGDAYIKQAKTVGVHGVWAAVARGFRARWTKQEQNFGGRRWG
jgi:hypothetical protein